jgi:dienelactone hydrolase
VALEPRVLSEEALPDHRRLLIRYRVEAGVDAEAYLLIPKDDEPAGARRPGMIVLHQTSETTSRDPVGLAGREPMHLALHLVRRGYVCVAPANFLWATASRDYEQVTADVLAREPWETGMAKMTWDATRATDLLAARPEVDLDRVGSIGHSLGAKEALYLAAFDPRVRAAVACEGGVGLAFTNWDAPWYLGGKIKRPGFAHDHHELIALIAPRALLIVGGEADDGAKTWPYVAANLPLWRLIGAQDRLGLFRHAHGHDFPPPGEDREAVYGWVDHWLKRE